MGFWCILHWNIILKVKEWLQNLGIGDQTAVPQDEDGPDDEAEPLHHDESSKNRYFSAMLKAKWEEFVYVAYSIMRKWFIYGHVTSF